jgi:hypothetical protein
MSVDDRSSCSEDYSTILPIYSVTGIEGHSDRSPPPITTVSFESAAPTDVSQLPSSTSGPFTPPNPQVGSQLLKHSCVGWTRCLNMFDLVVQVMWYQAIIYTRTRRCLNIGMGTRNRKIRRFKQLPVSEQSMFEQLTLGNIWYMNS